MSQSFFQLIPPHTKFPFVERARYFIMLSLALVAVSFGAMIFNQTTRGSMLNFGIDFQGGSQVRLQLSETPDVVAIRASLEELGYEGSSAVRVPDADNEILIRVKETITVDAAAEAACAESAATIDGANLLPGGFYHPGSSSKLFLSFDKAPDPKAVELVLAEAGCAGEAVPGAAKDGVFVVEFNLEGIGHKIAAQLDEILGAGSVLSILSSETVGAKVGNQLKVDGALSLLYAIGFIFLYVMLRFDLRFAPGGIVALTHDALITIGAFALTYKEFNLQTIAALLTIIGYSINDTIVVFDRIRERVARERDRPIRETCDLALNDTLSRTVLTSGTTLLVVIATWVFGTGVIKDFAFALMIGILVGTYSSLFIATPIFIFVNDRFYQGKGHLLSAEAAPKGTGMLLGAATGDDDGDETGAAAEAAAAAAPRTDGAARRRPAGAARAEARSQGDGTVADVASTPAPSERPSGDGQTSPSQTQQAAGSETDGDKDGDGGDGDSGERRATRRRRRPGT